MLETLLSQLAAGLVIGGLYVLIAIGLSVIFGLLGIVNFAHGNFFALGAYFAITLLGHFGWWAVPLAPILVGLVGMAVERLLIRQLYDKEPLVSLIITFALALMIQAGIHLVYGGVGLPFSQPPIFSGIFLWGPVLITKYRAFVFVLIVVLLLLLWAFMSLTPYGRILRAGARDPEMIGLLGIPLPRVFTAAFGLGCLLAGVGGVMAAPLWTVTPAMSELAIMPAFVVVTIGGLGSFAGAVIAGLLIGVVNAVTIWLYPSAATAMMYAFMAFVLLVRPRGLLGERWERFE
jgi:branched-chain amino acid transport system permease protein